jgi:hypothetical protein
MDQVRQEVVLRLFASAAGHGPDIVAPVG